MKTLSQLLREVASQHISHALRVANGNKAQAAKLLGVSRKGVYRLIAKYDIKMNAIVTVTSPLVPVPRDLNDDALFGDVLRRAS